MIFLSGNETREELKEKFENLQKQYIELNKMKRELEKELDRQINARIINEEFIERNFISKDKIREKIKQLEIVKNAPVKDNSYTYKECIEYGIEELKELSEENKNENNRIIK